MERETERLSINVLLFLLLFVVGFLFGFVINLLNQHKQLYINHINKQSIVK